MADELMDYDEAVRRYDPVVGLEVHVELSTATKMFDAAPNAFGGEPNSRVTPTSVGPLISTPRPDHADRRGRDSGERLLQHLLDAQPFLLALPARVGLLPIGDIEDRKSVV